MNEITEGAAAPATEQAVIAPAATEQATQEQSVSQDAATENAETQQTEQPEGEQPKKRSTSERYRRKISAQAGVIERLASENAEYQRRLQGGPQVQLPKPDAYPLGEHDPNYIADLTATKTAHAFGEQLNQRDQQFRQERYAEQRSEAAEDFLERAEVVKARIPDFDATVAAFADRGGKFSQTVIEELHGSEHGPALVYQLAKNPQLAAELNAMLPREVAREIGRLEARVSLPNPKTRTSAPPPLRAPQGGASPPVTLANLAKSDDVTDYIAMRRQQDKARA